MNETPRAQFGCRWGLYVILDAGMAQCSLEAAAEAALGGGARVVQIREKGMDFESLVEAGRRVVAMARAAGAQVIVNDNPYVAVEIDADGVHVGQMDIPVDLAREVVGPARIVGLSTHTRQQVLASQFHPVDYIGVGPLYATGTKVQAYTPVGPALVEWAAANVQRPIVAIGGVTAARAPEAIAAGAANVAMISDLMVPGCVTERVAEARRVVEAALAEGGSRRG